MTYSAADFSSLPKAALDALGVRVEADLTLGRCSLAGPCLQLDMEYDLAAALLIGMVVGKVNWMQLDEHDVNWVCILYEPADTHSHVASAPTPLAAVMAAYAKAVMA